MVFAKKKWGQNFLVDNNLLDKIIQEATEESLNIKEKKDLGRLARQRIINNYGKEKRKKNFPISISFYT